MQLALGKILGADSGSEPQVLDRSGFAGVPTGVHVSGANARYLATKAASGVHTLDVPLSAE
jgi:hypothetical protein